MNAKPMFMVIEKDSHLRFAYRVTLEAKFPDCTVIDVESCAQALRTLSKQPVDVVLVNQEATDARGTEVVARICDQFPAVPIVSVNDAPLEGQVKAAGARVFVEVSNWTQIGKAVSSVLAERSSEGESLNGK